MAEDERFPVKLFPTATATDVLFYVIMGRMDKRKIPTYGTRYNDITPRSEDWPHHHLVFVSPPDADGKQKWFFAADRENEDLYNWTLGQGEELIRTYLVRRSLYLQRSAAEAAAIPKQAGEFTYPAVATLDSKFTKYGFADDTVLEAPDELRSLYIVVKRRYLRPTIVDISYDEQLDIQIKTTYTIVPTDHDLPASIAGAAYELEPVNTFHSREVKKEAVPKSNGWTLADYVKKRAVRTNIPNLPRELVSVNVVWNSSYSIGTQDYYFFKTVTGESITLGKSAEDSASSSASVVPEVQINYRDIEASNLPATEYDLMIEGDATEAAVIARLTEILNPTDPAPPEPVVVEAWPVFRPESTTINTTGQSINVRVNVGISLEGAYSNAEGLTMQGMDRSTSDDFSVNLTVGGIQISPCIHGDIDVTGGTSRSQLVASTAAMTMYNSLVGSNSATKTKSGTAYATVTPSVIPAVSGVTTIPTDGHFALSINYGREVLGYNFVTVTVLDASNLA